MNNTYRTPAPVAVVLGVVLIFCGIFCLLLNWSNMNENDEFIANADAVLGECTVSGDNSGSNKSYLKTTVKYVYDGKRYEDIVVDNYGQFFLAGDEVNLFVNPDRPTQCVIRYKTTDGQGETYTMFTFLGLGVGALMVIVGVSRIRRGVIW